MARDRPSPYGEVPFFYRSAGALGCAYGNLRGPSPYDEGGAFCRRCPGRQGISLQAGLMPSAALLHRDQEVSPTGQVTLRKAHGKSPKTDWNI